MAISLDKPWYEYDAKELYKALFEYLKSLDTAQSYQQTSNLRHLRLYGNMEAAVARGYSFVRAEPSVATQHRVTLNIVQSMIDTLVDCILDGLH